MEQIGQSTIPTHSDMLLPIGQQVSGMPLSYLSCLSYTAELASCSRVPTAGAQSLTLQRSLTGALVALASLLLSDGHTTPPPEVVMSEQTQVIRRL